MPRVPPVCPRTGQPAPHYFIHTLDGNFVDSSGRTLLLRGVNLSGSSKAPVDQPSHVLDGFWQRADCGGPSFVGRPLNVDDGSADEHLQRLRGWGFNMIRYLVTWEALEHEGPGKYDHEFMDYTVRVLRKCKEYGFKVYMDPHQDTWSRFTGGSGAPYWTLPACGINPHALTATQGAILHCEYPSPAPDSRDPASFPSMLWATNYGRLAVQTLFTLFYGGRTYAPNCILDGVNIQDYLQSHFNRALGALAERIRDAGGLLDEVVIGWDSMNEPAGGFIGYVDLNVYPAAQGSILKKGTVPSPAQSFRLGMGKAQTVDNYKLGSFGSTRAGTVTIDPQGVCMWAHSSDEPHGVHPRWGWRRGPEWKLGTCIWAQHGVWDVETGYVLQPDYFRYLVPAPSSPSEHSAMPAPPPARVEVDFVQDFFLPQMSLYFATIHKIHPSAIAFIESPVFALPPLVPDTLLRGRACASPHFYDGLTLVTRHWNWFNADALGLIRGKYSSPIFAARFGEKAIRACIRSQLGVLKEDTLRLCAPPVSEPGSLSRDDKPGSAVQGSDPPAQQARYPTIIGEIGTPFDMDGRASYDPRNPRYRNYNSQERALDASLSAADGPNVLNYTMWTYSADNSHEWGDGWNMEDLSVWSKEDLQRESAVVAARHGAGPSAPNGDTLAPKGPLGAVLFPLPPHTHLAFLRDGARAVKAFCRPWPVSIVGLPVDIEFDISKAVVKIEVRVRAEDMPVVREGSDEHDASSDELASKRALITAQEGSGRKMSPLPTEIFLPLVHFASDGCVSRALGLAGGRREQAEPNARVAAEFDAEQEDSGPTTGTVTPDVYTSTVTLPLKESSADAVSPPESRIHTEAYDITVKVSEGYVELCEGAQMLRWFYPVPETDGADDQVWIEVRRTGGAIKYPHDVGLREMRARDKCAAWLAALGCGELGCTVM